MIEKINYNAFFNQALQHIKRIRNPHSDKPEQKDLMWNTVLQQSLFKFGGDNLKKYCDIIDEAKKISILYLSEIIYYLQREESMFDLIDSNSIKENYPNICFVLKDLRSDTLLIFKEIEECNYWKVKDKEPEDIQFFMKKNKASSCNYVYLMFEYAYLQIIGHNDDELDPGRGYNAYSIKWFFETYFGADEYIKFNIELRNYILEVNNYLGYILIKSLTPNAMINFRKITEREIIKFPFEILSEKKAKGFELSEDEFVKIKDQFIGKKTYLLMLGNHHYSESLITAEWLYDSMKKAQAIDLTVIGMGYFKAVEQLLFELICLHKNENRRIKGVSLDSDNIRNNKLDTTIGAMANFYKDNLDILNDDLSLRTREYIRETIFDYRNLRNGYFHKDNIHNWDRIEEIRIASFSMIFLLLGAQKLTDDDLAQLGMPNTDEFSDYSRLCEYVNFHCNNLFFLNSGEEDIMVYGCSDMNSKIVDNKYIKYSGVYFRKIGKNTEAVLFLEKDLPKNIYLGKYVFGQKEGITINTVKVKKIFENGRYIGPSIIEEEDFDY